MDEIRFTRKAVEDLSDIWNYTADMWSERQADTYNVVANCSRDEFCLFRIDNHSFFTKRYIIL